MSTAGMVSHRQVSRNASRTLRACGALMAYAMVLVTGTAVLIAAFSGHDGRRYDPQVQLGAATEAGAQAHDAFLLASRNTPDDKRGF
jgi:hypothetical protein